jgi:hypothetical protein
MRRYLLATAIGILCATAPLGALAQESCSADDQASLDACVTQATATCLTAFPQCQTQPVSLEALLAKIDLDCLCETAKNYGQYRSCAAHLIAAFKKLTTLDDAAKQTIKEHNAACKEAIKNHKGHKGPKK